jgi:hypothetical protein
VEQSLDDLIGLVVRQAGRTSEPERTDAHHEGKRGHRSYDGSPKLSATRAA